MLYLCQQAFLQNNEVKRFYIAYTTGAYMFKKSLILTWILSLLLTFSSCGLDYRYSLDEDLHNQIEIIFEEDENDPSHIIYKDKKYIYYTNYTTNQFYVDIRSNEDDVMVSWNGNRYFGYVNTYYSYTTVNPLFIYYKSWIFLLESYDYSKDTFVLENTALEYAGQKIFFSKQSARKKEFYSQSPEFNFSNPILLSLHPKKCSRISACLELVCIENQWYVSLQDSKDVWIPSDEFIDFLSENELISI